MNNRKLGAKYETRACDYLIHHGCQMIDRNFHFHKIGEIDLIYYDTVEDMDGARKYLCFGEVKFRANNSKGTAKEAVTFSKQKQISKVAAGFLKMKGMSFNIPIRFDVIAIDGENIDWIKNAFYYVK